MIKLIKKNYEFIFCLILFAIILLIAFNPKPYINSTFLGIRVWATIVLPSLFVFFILTKLFMTFNSSLKIFSNLDKLFFKIYKVKHTGGYIFFMSAISGYPIGAKLISEFYLQGTISKDEAMRLISFASTSGPMFIIGSVAVALFNNYKLGLVVLISHILSSLINGLIYKNIGTENSNFDTKIVPKNTKKTINDIMFDTIISLLMVGGFVTISFAIMEFILSLPIINLITNNSILSSIIKGIIEVTNGCVSLTNAGISPKIIAIILSGLISFGGLSIHLQSQLFLSKVGIKYRYFLLTKVTQTIISLIISGVIAGLLF